MAGVAATSLQSYAAAAEVTTAVVPAVVDELKMEPEEHLAREYVQEFVLDHLDPGDVKREAAAAAAAVAQIALANDKVKPLLTALARQQQQQPTPPQPTTTASPPQDSGGGGTPKAELVVHNMAQVEPSQHMRLTGSPPAGCGHPLPGSMGPLTPPAHELEQAHGLPLYGQPPGAVQVQHVVQAGVLVKLPYGPGLTNLSHPGTPPDTPPVSASPPALQNLQRLDRLERMQLHHQHQQHLQQAPHQHHPQHPQHNQQQQQQHQHHHQHQQPEAILPDGMPWLTQSLRQEPLDLRPHCPQEHPGSEPEVENDHWPPHHLPDLVQHHHHPGGLAGHPNGRHSRHTGWSCTLT